MGQKDEFENTRVKLYMWLGINLQGELQLKRGILLIPEIEGPGHAKSFNEHYREIFGNRTDSDDIEQLVTENGDVDRRVAQILTALDARNGNETRRHAITLHDSKHALGDNAP